jgi:hypothetical protein
MSLTIAHCSDHFPKKYGYPDQLSLIRWSLPKAGAQLGTSRLVSSSNAGIAMLPLGGEFATFVHDQGEDVLDLGTAL